MNCKLMRLRNKIGSIFIIGITVGLLFILTGCSSGNSSQMASSQTEIDQLIDENEKLREKLEALESTITSLDTTDSQEDFSEPDPVLTNVDIVPPERTPSELLLGQWFYQRFYEDGLFSYTQVIVFNADGTGTMSRRYYIPIHEIEATESFPSSLPDLDSSVKCSWNLNGDTVHIELENGEAADFTFLAEQKLLQMKNGNDSYGKEMPSGMDQYVERSLYAENIQVQEAARMRNFLGLWYLDVITWMFNEDGTGIIDIPELGDQPATTRQFTYSVTGDSSYLCLILDWEDGNTSYFYPEFSTDGSISLKGVDGSEAAKLTKSFDIDNCPFSEAIISNQMSVLTGSIFYDILPEL